MMPTFLRQARRGFAVSTFVCVLVAADRPKAVFPETSFHFGRAVRGAVIEHDFLVRNAGSAPLAIEKVRLTPPLIATSMPTQVMPGGESFVRVKLDTSGVKGAFDGTILISLNDPDFPEPKLTFEGQIVATVEVAPMPAFIVAAQRGQTKESTVEIINHEQEALRIEQVEHSAERFTTRLEMIEEGRRYRLTLTLKPDGPGKRNADTIILHTSSKTSPLVRIAAYTYLRERVYTFPDAVDLGALAIDDIRRNPRLLEQTAQTLMIYQADGSDFKVQLSTDVSGCELKAERGPKGDRYQATVTLNGDKLKVGQIKGSILVQTNDAQFPTLTVPVSGWILDR